MSNEIKLPEQLKYSIAKTATKAAPPFIIIILVNAMKAALNAGGITIDDQTLYTIALSGLGAVSAFINWIKNRKKTA
jgi:GTP cyclohydrolase I